MIFFTFLKDRSIKKIIKNAGIILSGNSFASGVNMISFAIMANRTQATSLALFALAQNYTMIMNDIFNVQTWESLIKFGAAERTHRRMVSLFKASCLIDVVSAIVGTVVSIALVRPVFRWLEWDQSSAGITSLYCLTILFNWASLTIGIPRIFNRFDAIAKVQAAAAVIRLSAIACLPFFGINSIRFYVLAYVVTDVGANIAVILFGLYLLQLHYGQGWWREPVICRKEHLHFIWWTNLRTIIRIPVRHFDMLIIGSVMSLEQVGAYRVYKEIAGIITRIGDPVNQALFPEYSRLISLGDSRDAMQTGEKTILLMSLLGGGFVLPMLALARPIVTQFFGPTYTGSLPALQALIVFYGISFSLIPVNSLFIAAGYAKSSFWVVALTNSVYLLTAYGLGKAFGIYGMAVAYIIQSLLNSGIKMFILAKDRRGFTHQQDECDGGG